MPQIYEQTGGLWAFQADDGSIQTFATEQEAYMAQREAEYISDVKAANTAIWEGINQLVALQREWVALDYGNTLDASGGVTAADVGAVVFDTANALVAVLNAGHATNMAKLL